MPDIKLYKLAPTRSARGRSALLEVVLLYESLGNDPAIIGSEALRQATSPRGS